MKEHFPEEDLEYALVTAYGALSWAGLPFAIFGLTYLAIVKHNSLKGLPGIRLAVVAKDMHGDAFPLLKERVPDAEITDREIRFKINNVPVSVAIVPTHTKTADKIINFDTVLFQCSAFQTGKERFWSKTDNDWYRIPNLPHASPRF